MKGLLENDIIRLRAPEPEDLDKFYSWENDTSTWGFGSTITPFSRFTLKQYLIDSNNDFYSDKQLRLVIVHKESEEAIGAIDLYDFDPFNSRAGVGIFIDEDYREKGIGHQALLLLEEYASEFLKIHQLYANISTKNNASIGLFTKCGFKKAGELKDWLSRSEGYDNIFVFQKIYK